MKKGFATSAILYTILLLFIVLLVGILNNLQNKKVILDALKEDTINALNQDTVTDAILEQITNLNNKVVTLEDQLNNLQVQKTSSRISLVNTTSECKSTLSYTGVYTEIPANAYFCITARMKFDHAAPVLVVISDSPSAADYFHTMATGDAYSGANMSTTYCGTTTSAQSYYVWGQCNADAKNNVLLTGFYTLMDS